MYKAFVEQVRSIYKTDEFIPLHAPRFIGNEKKYLEKTIDSTFVSSVGEFVTEFENKIAEFTGAKYAVATVNGTAALHIALLMSGVQQDDEVITQSLSFVATANAIKYCGADPVFLDVDRTRLSLAAEALRDFLQKNTSIENGVCRNNLSGKVIRACVPVHIFGHPADLKNLQQICHEYHIALVEDCAESLGSFSDNMHTGNVGSVAALSFNGNKIITTGGGGMIMTNDEVIARRARHITTTAKVAHQWKFEHDEVGYNYWLPNLNAALGVAQMEQLSGFIDNKRRLAEIYGNWSKNQDVVFFSEPPKAQSNYWLNTLILNNVAQRDEFLEYTNKHGVMTRPLWTPLHLLPMYQHCYRDDLLNTLWLNDHVVNIPSSVVL